MIIIPFLFFYIASIPFRYVVDLWDTRSFTAFDWNRIMDIFCIESRSDYLSLNVPLWFLLALFWIQVFSFVLFKLPRWIILVLSALSLFFITELNRDFPTPFMLNNALAWFGYFGFGYLFGKPLIKFLNSMPRKMLVFIITLAVVLLCFWIESLEVADWYSMIRKAKLFAFVICFMTFFSFFNDWKKLEILRFFGKNSLIVLGAHLWILVPIERVMFRLLRFHSPWVGLGMSIATAIILIPIILWMNKNIPYLVGKKPEVNSR